MNILHFTPCSCRAYGYSFWIGVLVPFGVIYVFNWIMYIGIIVSVLRRPNLRKGLEDKHKQWKENLFIIITLSVLFGLGWVSGLLASTDVDVDFVRIPFEWVFTILNCSQGVLIFYMYCLRLPEVRKKLSYAFSRCQSLMNRVTSPPTSKTNSTSVTKSNKLTPMRSKPSSDASNKNISPGKMSTNNSIKEDNLVSPQQNEYIAMKLEGELTGQTNTGFDIAESIFMDDEESV